VSGVTLLRATMTKEFAGRYELDYGIAEYCKPRDP
jgi:hypothetical protein